jgi:hypothetical protein
MRIPLTFVIFRVAAVCLTVLVLALFGLGMASRGPLDGLGSVTSQAISWLHDNTGVTLR